MAATPLKHTTIWIPSRTVGERSLVNDPVLQLLPAARGGAPVALQRCSLEALPATRSAVVVFDARDVALMRVKLPQLSGARLARAIPNVLEDQLLQEPHACTFVLGPPLGTDEHMVAVIDRSWFEFVIGALERRGIRLIAAWPGQLALPFLPGTWSLACLNDDLALRLSPSEGMGWFAGSEPADRTSAIAAALEAAGALMPKPTLLSACMDDDAWRASIDEAAHRAGLAVQMAPLAVDPDCPIDLLSGRQGNAGQRWLASVDWRTWRLPAGIAAAAVLVAVVGMNLHWAQLARERTELRARMEATFRQAFPKAQVVVDPLLQMQRQTADLRLRAGQNGPEDFLPLLTRFTQALGPRAADSLASLEYREGRLKARWRPGGLDAVNRETLRAACQRAGLRLQFEGDAQAVISVAG